MSVHADRDDYHRAVLEVLRVTATPGSLAALDRPLPVDQIFEVFADVRPALTTLKRWGLALAIVSDVGPGARKLYERLGWTRFFSAYAISAEVGCCKPHRACTTPRATPSGSSPPNAFLLTTHPDYVLGALDLDVGNTLANFASHVVKRLGSVLAGAPDSPEPTVPARVLPAHTVLSVESLCVIEPDGEQRPAAVVDLVTDRPVVGQALLCQPIRQFASSLEEWLRICPRDPRGLNLFQGHGFIGDVAVATINSTVFPVVQMPRFLLLEYEELAEFVASLDAIFVAHRDKLASSKNRLDEIMVKLTKAAEGGKEKRGAMFASQAPLAGSGEDCRR